jgi:translation initiation factor IF-1
LYAHMNNKIKKKDMWIAHQDYSILYG